MSKTFKTRSKIIEQTVLVAVTCDICGRQAAGEDWDAEMYEICDIQVSMRSGYQYPGDDSGVDKESYDICPICFTGKLKPWLSSLGASPTKSPGY